MIYNKTINVDSSNYDVFAHIDANSYKIFINGIEEYDSKQTSDYLKKYCLIVDSVRPKGLCLVIGAFSRGIADLIKNQDNQVHLCDPFLNELEALYELIAYYPKESYVTTESYSPDQLPYSDIKWDNIFVDLPDSFDYKFLKKISMSLKKDGRLVTYSPNFEEMREILNKKFEVASEIRISKFYGSDPLVIQSWKNVKNNLEGHS